MLNGKQIDIMLHNARGKSALLKLFEMMEELKKRWRIRTELIKFCFDT